MISVSPSNKHKTTILRTSFMQIITLNEALELFDNNQSELSRELGLNRGTMRSYLSYGGTQLIQVKELGVGEYKLEFINKNWTK
ncbi:DNA binding HTH domain protein [Vibrio phage 1.216.O._10N.222.55.C12]|nr:DNA binding HTH domain protein [Vibrio phage 1.135.O._10N.222.54.B6]AUR96138.1 DNA binding HTH domain protein [Vibrio phage 1.216.O._10N.222.55.C12]